MSTNMPDPDLNQTQEPDHSKNVAKAGGIMVASLLLSRVLGMVRDSIVAGKFGADINTDAYRLAFQLPDMLFFLISGGALSSAFIPVFSEYWHTDRKSEAWKVFSSVLTIVFLALSVVMLLVGIFALPLYEHILAPNKTAEIYPLIARMSRILLPAQFAFFLGGLMMGTLYARNVFSVPGLGPNIYNLGIIFGALVISQFVDPGVVGMCWGAAIGAVLGNVVVPFLVIKKMGFEFKPSLDTSHEGTRKVFKLMLPVILGLSLPSVFSMIMQAFASGYKDGTNTVLDSSNKLMQVPLGIFGQSLAIAVFPVLTQFYVAKNMPKFREQLTKTMRTVLYLSIPASVILGVLAPQIVGVLLLHGKFTVQNARDTADCLRLFSFGIWAWCLHPILMRAFYSIQDTKTPVIIGTGTTVFFVGLLLLLRLTPLGYKALPLAGSIAPIAMVLVMAMVLAPRIGGLDIRPITQTLWKCFMGTAPVLIICGIVAFSPIAANIEGHKMTTIWVTLAASFVSMWGYYFATKNLQMPETEYIDRAMARINKKIRRS
jgi:putative peptidoglycan lipid II flippase